MSSRIATSGSGVSARTLGSREGGRAAQRRRTRQALLDAANELLDLGERPSLEEVAAHADVSRATVYRYFPSADDLLTDAVLDRSIVPAEVLFPDTGGDLVDRVLAVEEALHTTLLEDEVSVHVVSRIMAEAWLAGDPKEHGARPGRRLPLIDAALDPHTQELGPEVTARLRNGLALAIGTEAMVALRDVCRLSPDEARETARWTIRAIVRSALSEAKVARGVAKGVS